jgi:hypothetical protein
MSIEFISGYGESILQGSELAILEGENLGSISFHAAGNGRHKRNLNVKRPLSQLLGASAVNINKAAGKSAGGSSASISSSAPSKSASISSVISSSAAVVPVIVKTAYGSVTPGVVAIDSASISSGSGSKLIVNSNDVNGPIVSISDASISAPENKGKKWAGGNSGGGSLDHMNSNSGRGSYAPGADNDIFLGATGRSSSPRHTGGGITRGDRPRVNRGAQDSVIYMDETIDMYNKKPIEMPAVNESGDLISLPIKISSEKGKLKIMKDNGFDAMLGELLGGIKFQNGRWVDDSWIVEPTEFDENGVATDGVRDSSEFFKNSERRKMQMRSEGKSIDRLTRVPNKKKSFLRGDAVSNNNILEIKLKHLIQPDEWPRVRKFMQDSIKETGLLGEEELLTMTDEQLGGFFSSIWKGIKSVGKGIWKGVKSVGKFVGKVGTGIWKGVKTVGNVIGKGVVALGKGLWTGVSLVGKGLLAVGKFAWQNALPILGSVASLLPGGGVISTLLDVITGITGGQQSQQPDTSQMPQDMSQQPDMSQMPPEQYQYNPQNYEQASNAPTQEEYQQMQMQPQQQNVMMSQQMPPQYYQTQQYDAPQYYAEYQDVPYENSAFYEEFNNQEMPSDDSEYASDLTPDEIAFYRSQGLPIDENGNYLPEQDVYTDYSTGEEMMGNIFQDIVNSIKKGINFITNPVKRQEVSNILTKSNQVQIDLTSFFKNNPDIAKQQIDMLTAQSNVTNTGKGIFETYGMWIALGLLGVVLMLNR